MKWINKNDPPYKKAGNKICKAYLDKCRNHNNRYQGIRYDGRDPGTGKIFCGNFRKVMTNILLENQDSYCCYCMRKLKINQKEEDSDMVVTREHIIPRGFTQADDEKLSSYYQLCPELSDSEVILTDKFEHKDYNQSKALPPYPHKIAFNNLVVSCNGTFPYVRNNKDNKAKICCNEYRQEKDAYPIYFIRDIENMVDYLDDGDIQIKITVEDKIRHKIEDVIRNTHLACDSLKDIRYLWFLLSDNPKQDIYQCRNEDQRNHLLSKNLYKDGINIDDRISNLHSSFIKDDFWQTFLLYDYFYDVYNQDA